MSDDDRRGVIENRHSKYFGRVYDAVAHASEKDHRSTDRVVFSV